MGSKRGPIIILEDDADEQELLAHVFEQMQIRNQLKFFATGESMLSYLRTTSDQPFIIISDVNIPMINGLEVKQMINEDASLRRKSIPFIFLSTSAERKAVEQAYDINAQGFFLKQNTITDIQRYLRLILDYWLECKHTNNL